MSQRWFGLLKEDPNVEYQEAAARRALYERMSQLRSSVAYCAGSGGVRRPRRRALLPWALTRAADVRRLRRQRGGNDK